MPNLTERRHEQTRAEIADVAVALFLQRGFADTTMDDVAEAAGVSRRTAYRHFPSKDDLVFEQPRRWLVHFDQEIATPRADEDRREMCRRGLLAVSRLIQDNAGPIARAFQVLVATPSLRGYNGRTEDEWYERYLELFTLPGRLSAARAVEIATVAARARRHDEGACPDVGGSSTALGHGDDGPRRARAARPDLAGVAVLGAGAHVDPLGFRVTSSACVGDRHQSASDVQQRGDRSPARRVGGGVDDVVLGVGRLHVEAAHGGVEGGRCRPGVGLRHQRRIYSMRRPDIARAMTSCWISDVPSKIVWILASRCQRSTGYSRV